MLSGSWTHHQLRINVTQSVSQPVGNAPRAQGNSGGGHFRCSPAIMRSRQQAGRTPHLTEGSSSLSHRESRWKCWTGAVRELRWSFCPDCRTWPTASTTSLRASPITFTCLPLPVAGMGHRARRPQAMTWRPGSPTFALCSTRCISLRVALVGHSIAGDELTAFAGAFPERVSHLVYSRRGL